VQESVDAVGLSIMSGAHMTLMPAVLQALHARGAADVVVFGGGIIPDQDAEELKKLGVAAIFKPGASTQEIVDWVARELRPKVEAASGDWLRGGCSRGSFSLARPRHRAPRRKGSRRRWPPTRVTCTAATRERSRPTWTLRASFWCGSPWARAIRWRAPRS